MSHLSSPTFFFWDRVFALACRPGYLELTLEPRLTLNSCSSAISSYVLGLQVFTIKPHFWLMTTLWSPWGMAEPHSTENKMVSYFLIATILIRSQLQVCQAAKVSVIWIHSPNLISSFLSHVYSGTFSLPHLPYSCLWFCSQCPCSVWYFCDTQHQPNDFYSFRIYQAPLILMYVCVCVVYVCVHLAVYTCPWRCVCLCVYMCVEAKGQHWVLSSIICTLWDRVSHWTWSSLIFIDYLANNLQGVCPSLLLQCWHHRLVPSYLAFMWVLHI